MTALKDSSEKFVNRKKGNGKSKGYAVPGWNEYVDEAHVAARDAFHLWLINDKPKQGPFFNIMKQSRAHFKYALRQCKKMEVSILKLTF